jgi:hypothetical protein
MTTLTRRVQGIPDAFCTRGLVCKYVQRNAHERNRYRRSNPAFPAQWLYGLCRALPGERIRLVTVACGLKVSPEPGWAGKTSASLAPATGVGTTRFYRTLKRRSSARCMIAHGKPPCDRTHAPDAAASTASRPNVRDDGQRPSEGRDGGICSGESSDPERGMFS